MNLNPLISVVIPCYNDGKFLPETIHRLKQQTLKDFEIIIVNDGSNDSRTLEVLQDLLKQGITVLHKENGRMSSARNFGVKHARGTYIVALDADDYYHPTFFEKGIEILNREKNIAVVTSYIQLFGEFKKTSKPRGGNEFNFLFSNQCPACAMVRKQVWDEVNGYDEKMIYGYEDWEFYIRITKKGWIIHVIPQKLLFYRQTKKSTHKNDTLPNRKEIINYIVDKHKDWYLEKLKELIFNDGIIYRNSRVSYQLISEVLTNRLFKRHR